MADDIYKISTTDGVTAAQALAAHSALIGVKPRVPAVVSEQYSKSLGRLVIGVGIPESKLSLDVQKWCDDAIVAVKLAIGKQPSNFVASGKGDSCTTAKDKKSKTGTQVGG